jgi:hypothetical protein
MRICEQFQVAVMIGRPEKNVRNGNGIQVTTQHVFRVINITGQESITKNGLPTFFFFKDEDKRQTCCLLNTCCCDDDDEPFDAKTADALQASVAVTMEYRM